MFRIVRIGVAVVAIAWLSPVRDRQDETRALQGLADQARAEWIDAAKAEAVSRVASAIDNASRDTLSVTDRAIGWRGPGLATR